MGEVVEFPRHRIVREFVLNKRQLAKRLNRSTRWVELRVREGMPSEFHGDVRIFRMSRVQAWLRAR